ncbi:MAG: hypothetical protein J5U19_14675 [Candidatus Methanoperedens sp.]|nr:hypothetical protein [Candidatus Methanoperedens sp.]
MVIKLINPQPNTLILPKDVEKCVLLVGGEDLPIVKKIIDEIANSEEIVHSRGFHTYRCRSISEGTPFTLAVTGVGPSCTEIAVTEYANCGARIFLRAGTSGGLSSTPKLGSVIITTEALRFDGVSDLYVQKSVKAVADTGVIESLMRSADSQSIEYTKGVTLTTSGYYAMGGISKNGVLSFGGYSIDSKFKPVALGKLQNIVARMSAINVDMETATLFVLSEVYKLKSGAVCGLSNRVPWEPGEQIEFTNLSLKNAIFVAVKAFDYLQ